MSKTKKCAKVTQPNKHSIDENMSTIKVIDLYKDLFVLRERPVSEVFIERFAADMINWATNNEDALVLIDFYVSRKVNPKVAWDWEKRFPQLKAAKELTLQIIGSRREKGALKNKLNPAMVMSQQAKYDPSWWKLEESRAQLKALTQQKNDPDIKYVIAVEDFSEKTQSSVKKKKKKKDKK